MPDRELRLVVASDTRRVVETTKHRMWEISENLHRAELTQLEYDEQVADG